MPSIPFDPSNISNNLTNYTLSPYTVGTGMGYTVFLIPLSFIAVALFVKTKSIVPPAMFMTTTSSLFAGVFVFLNAPVVAIVYICVCASAIVVLVMDFVRRR